MHAQTVGIDFVPPYQPGATPPSGYQLHEAPRVPGANYQAWDFTNTLYGPWTQLNFAYGNSRVTTTVVVDAYNQTDGSYRNLQANQGIDQVFLTMRFPDAFGDYGGLTWNIGSFPSRYGTAGKYDAGMYETYQFGRTHVSGEVLTATFSNLDPMGDWTITLEHGIGAKLDFMPFTNNQNYQIFGTPRRPLESQRLAGSGYPERGLPAVGGTGAAGVDLPAPRAHHGEVPEDVELRLALPLHLDAGRQLGSAQLAAAERLRCGPALQGPDPGQHGGPGRGGALHRRRVR